MTPSMVRTTLFATVSISATVPAPPKPPVAANRRLPSAQTARSAAAFGMSILAVTSIDSVATTMIAKSR